MKKLFIFLIWVLLAGKGVSIAQDINLQDYYRQIDEAIQRSSEYVEKHEIKIGLQRQDLKRQSTPGGKFQCSYRLYELYKPFISDSAIYFLHQCIALADQMNDPSAAVRCRSLLAIGSANIGMYDEALCILDSIDTRGADTLALGTYYEAYNNVYGELCYYTRFENMHQIYLDKSRYYEKLMMDYLPDNSEVCFLRREQRAQAEGRIAESMKINNEWLATVEPGSHPYALVALYRYIEYKLRGDSIEMMHWLTESVLTDIKTATMDQGSMWELANELMLQGDIERASRYISFTSDCANRYGSRQRNWQIAPLLTAIAKNYKAKSEHTTTQLRVTVAVISILALLLLGALLFLHRRHKQLTAARNELHNTNGQLAALNQELKTANHQLSETNEQFAVVNSQLAESNRVKEEYIGRFMSLCSQYIDKLDAYRKMVNKKMKNKEFDELFRISKSTELKETELEELYENFDSVFLHLFPSFIDDFNALLQPEAQQRPRQENRLNTEMRIFALIRLGIEDSSKIAEFLHYSVNTIYNYRARIKNGAVASREHFEQDVKKLGQIQ